MKKEPIKIEITNNYDSQLIFKDSSDVYNDLEENIDYEYNRIDHGICDDKFEKLIGDYKIVYCYEFSDSDEIIKIYHPTKKKLFIKSEDINAYSVFKLKSISKKYIENLIFRIDNFLNEYKRLKKIEYYE